MAKCIFCLCILNIVVIISMVALTIEIFATLKELEHNDFQENNQDV